MKPIRFEGMTHNYGQPENWDVEKHGPCNTLPVMVVDNEFISIWEFDEVDRAKINAGQHLLLVCHGAQIPVGLVITDQGVEKVFDPNEAKADGARAEWLEALGEDR